ncbi:MAG: Gfo/Idh/MocA family oxidoreductase [Lachnospiraceae bacterium]|nr:Gfo/Idh/MocA family oxidoreductase [Lachnospiraceae bacterium]
MEKKIRYGLIGIGAQGGTYARLLTNGPSPFPGMPVAPCPPHCALGALCDIDPAKEAYCKENYPDVPFFSDWKELIASGTCDAIITTLPHFYHHEIAIYAMEHGMNVLGEKPAGIRQKDVLAMNACAKAHPEVSFGIMFNQRTNLLYQKIKEIVASGEMGQIRRTQWMINNWWRPDSYYQQSAWRATWGGEGGGVLVNQAPHQLDLWQWICGVPVKVFSKNLNGCHRDIAVENDVTMMCEFANGAIGTFTTCTHDACGTDRLEIDLDGGKIVVDDSKKATVYRYQKDGQPCQEDTLNASMSMMEVAMLTSGNGAGSLCSIETFENTDGWGTQHLTVMENFALHILTGSPLLAPGEEGINGVNLANSSQLSAWTGREVMNPCDPEEYAAELNKLIAAEGKFPVRE